MGHTPSATIGSGIQFIIGCLSFNCLLLHVYCCIRCQDIKQVWHQINISLLKTLFVLLYAARNYSMVSGVVGNMSDICWTHDINFHQGTNLFFFNLKVVGDRIQNGRTTWCCHFLPNLAWTFSRWLWHGIISFPIRMNVLKITACIYTEVEAFHQLFSFQSHINNSLIYSYVMSAYFTISCVSRWRMRCKLFMFAC